MNQLFILGAGKMATAISAGLVNADILKVEQMCAFDPDPQAAERFTQHTGIRCAADPVEGAAAAEAVLIAVKPQMLSAALRPLAGKLADKLIISIAAGVSLSKLSQSTGSARIVRVMPNTPALIGAGAAAYAPASGVAEADLEFVERLLNSVGLAVKLDERLMDAVTGLSGSGPAYVFAFIQALADGGVAEGLSRDTALKLAVQTVIGAAEMVKQTGLHPMVLCDQVTSPAGTTSRALELLSERGFAGTVMQAVRAAAQRSSELGK